MEKSVVRLSIAKKRFWNEYLEVMNPLFKLQSRERDVLACILMIAVPNKNNPKIEEKLLDYYSRVKIREYLKMSEASLNNNISELKKKGLLLKTDKGFKVHSSLLEVEYTNGTHAVEFRLNVR